jgi:hypothetical protein
MTNETTIERVERREIIDQLLNPPDGVRTDRKISRANVLALLEIADAITSLSAEVEKASWSRDPRT